MRTVTVSWMEFSIIPMTWSSTALIPSAGSTTWGPCARRKRWGVPQAMMLLRMSIEDCSRWAAAGLTPIYFAVSSISSRFAAFARTRFHPNCAAAWAARIRNSQSIKLARDA